MKPNRNLDAVALAFKDVRPSLLHEISVDQLDNCSGRSSIGVSGKRGRDKSPLIVQRLSYKSFHGKSKKYVRDTIETLCNLSKVTPSLDGDQDELERYYRELIHLNNAQIGSSEPLSFDEVVKEINRNQSFKRKEAKKNSFAKAQAEKMIKGEVSTEVISAKRCNSAIYPDSTYRLQLYLRLFLLTIIFIFIFIFQHSCQSASKETSHC